MILFSSLLLVANAGNSCIPSHFHFTGKYGTVNSFRAKIIHDSTYKEIVQKCESAGMNLPEPMTQEFNDALVEFWVSNDRWMGDLPVGIAADWKALSSGEPALFKQFKSPRPIIGQIDHYAVMNKNGEWHADTNEDRVFPRALCLSKEGGTKFEGHSINVSESHDPCFGKENCETFINSCETYPIPSDKISTIEATVNFKSSIDIQCSHGMPNGRWLNIFHISAGGEIGQPGDRFFAAWRFPHDERLHFALGAPEGGFAKYKNLNCVDGEWNKYTLEQRQVPDSLNTVMLIFSRDDEVLLTGYYGVKDVFTGSVDVFLSRRPSLREIASDYAVRKFYYQKFPEIEPEECTNRSDPCKGLENCQTFIDSCTSNPSTTNKIGTIEATPNFRTAIDVQCTHGMSEIGKPGDRFFAAWRFPSDERLHFALGVPEGGFAKYQNLNCNDGEWNTYVLEQKQDQDDPNVVVLSFSIDGNKIASYTYATSAVLSEQDGRYANIDEAQFGNNHGVAEALDTTTGETVIVKATLLQNADHWRNTQQEAATLRELDHANVVRFVDFLDRQMPDWAFGSMCFIIMEHCGGGSLADWIEKMKDVGRKPTMDEATLVGAQIISGLSYCHEKNKLHLDMKPENLFLLSDFITVKLGDFGSALSIRSVQESMTTSSGDPIKCTPLYAAPEILKEKEGTSSEKEKKSPRLDVWGFGLILQEVLTLEHPFGRVDGRQAFKTEILTNIQVGNRTTLFEIFGETDEYEEFEILLQKCTHPDRKRRPRNAIKLRDEDLFVDFLQRIENGERPSNIVPPPFPNENDDVQRLKEEIEQKDRTIVELQNRLNTFNEIMDYRLREEAKQKDEKIAKQNREIEQLKRENRSVKQEHVNLKKLNSELEQNFEYSSKIIDELKMKTESERKERENDLEKAKREIASLRSLLIEENERNHRESANQKLENERVGLESREQRRNNQPVAKNEFFEHLNWDVAEAGWHLVFKSALKDKGGDGWFYLSLWNNEGGIRFKAIAQQILWETGEESNRKEIESQADGPRQTIKYRYCETRTRWIDYVRFNVYFDAH
ncbi:Oidioi.mRNA.OKI2018_I69.chr1.g1718.t1.cds [Oikopleura dioica]|uniref:Oidioi.mRNA.OKI2018_I69.chr1.g1718.t1.cds n=1 Tax=Oikopleura dioica TaxID=34765 RepID=A0ABN7ST04_OIKDI|nr:Oidioi.mRNA.OKI2018_I69.chr1.g1718.t1.cds [Oikopleura dioica]